MNQSIKQNKQAKKQPSKHTVARQVRRRMRRQGCREMLRRDRHRPAKPEQRRKRARSLKSSNAPERATPETHTRRASVLQGVPHTHKRPCCGATRRRATRTSTRPPPRVALAALGPFARLPGRGGLRPQGWQWQCPRGASSEERTSARSSTPTSLSSSTGPAGIKATSRRAWTAKPSDERLLVQVQEMDGARALQPLLLGRRPFLVKHSARKGWHALFLVA